MGSGKKAVQPDRLRMNTGQHRRIRIAMALTVTALLAAAVRLYVLMVMSHTEYEQLALRNQSRTTQVSSPRGTIYDRNMNILACDTAVEHIYLAPLELKQTGADLSYLSQELGRILGKDPQWILEQAQSTGQRYRQIGSRVEEETAAQVRDLIQSSGISGIHLEPASKRYYPYGTLAAQVIGFTILEG